MLWLDDHAVATYPIETTIDDIPVCLYNPVSSEKGTIIVLSHATICNIHRKIMQVASVSFNEKAKKEAPHIYPLSYLAGVLKSLKNLIEHGKEQKHPLLGNLFNAGWTRMTLIEVIPKIESMVKGFFKHIQDYVNPYYFPTSPTTKSLEEWENTMAFHASRYLYSQSDFKLLGDVILPKEAIESLLLPLESLPKMSCYEYTLAVTDIKTAYSYYSEDWPDCKSFESSIKKWVGKVYHNPPKVIWLSIMTNLLKKLFMQQFIKKMVKRYQNLEICLEVLSNMTSLDCVHATVPHSFF